METLGQSFWLPPCSSRSWVTDLPRGVSFKLLVGLQCTLMLTIGIGTITRYLRVRLHQSLKTVATVVEVKLSDENVKGKYDILKEKFEASTRDQADVPTGGTLGTGV